MIAKGHCCVALNRAYLRQGTVWEKLNVVALLFLYLLLLPQLILIVSQLHLELFCVLTELIFTHACHVDARLLIIVKGLFKLGVAALLGL